MWDQLLPLHLVTVEVRIIPTYVGSTRRLPAAWWHASNHSHVCGINVNGEHTPSSMSESFPRMWDQRSQNPCKHKSRRIIPTYVGSTLYPFIFKFLDSNHSHVCGINAHHIQLLLVQYESFPRMLDQLLESFRVLLCWRIIPTYVGSTLTSIVLKPVNFESFPHMWDQHHLTFLKCLRQRIIPTYVGSTVHRPACTRDRANHSHVCGINCGGRCTDRQKLESFPRMWDQRGYKMTSLNIERIIPTYVGSTRNVVIVFLIIPNHSHVCGINCENLHVSILGNRIIPTYVGSTFPRGCLRFPTANHSHVCGINFTWVTSDIFSDESFPRMWDQLGVDKLLV